MRTTVYLNGKFCAQPTTGVQRVAECMVRALDAQVASGRFVLLHPPGFAAPALRHVRARPVGPPGLPLHLWEQIVLPWAARDGWLLNLAGAAPALASHQIAMLHDAAVFDHPEAYRPAFVAWYRWLFRRLSRRSDGLLTVSHFARERLVLALGPGAERLQVILNGADHLDGVEPDEAVLDRLALRGRPFVLAVGSANPTKNLAALVEAHALLGVDAPPLVIVGGTRGRVFAAAGLSGRPGLLLAGAVGDAMLVALYRHALALVFPSRYEGFGLPLLEAMGQGCPVVTTREASMPEVCGDAAYYLEGTDTAALTSGLRRVIEDEGLRDRLCVAGRQRAARFRWQAAAGELLQGLRRAGALP